MNRMFLIKTNAKHSIPQSSPFYISSLTTLPHLQKLTHRLECHLLFPHLTGWVWKPWTHIAQKSAVQQNQWPVETVIVRARPPLSTQTCSEPCKIPALSSHSPALPNTDYCTLYHVGTEHRERKLNLMLFLLLRCFLPHFNKKKKK